MDARNAPLRSHPPDKPATKGNAKDELSSSATLPPPGSEQRGRSQERDQQHYRSFSPFKRRGHSELPPIQTSGLGQFIAKSSTGPLGTSDSGFGGERPFLSKELAKPEVHSNKAAISNKEQHGDSHTEHNGSLDEKDREAYRKFRESLSSLDDSSSEGESEQRDSLVAEKKDQVRLFRSSLLAGAKAQEDRRGRSKRKLTPPDLPQIDSNVASEFETHDSTMSESKDDVVGVQENDDVSLPETLKSPTSSQGEGEQSLDALLDDLHAEDGEEPDMDAVTIQSGYVCAIPPEMLETKAEEGLSDAEVAVRRKKYGWNRLKEQKRNHIINFILFFHGPVQWVMEVSNTIRHWTLWSNWKKHLLTKFSQFQVTIFLAAGLADWIDFGIICGLLVLNAVVGFVQEYQAGNIIDHLKKSLALITKVVRNGSTVEIGAEEVVVGDIVYVEDVSL
jgi:H+-transporting ATPase